VLGVSVRLREFFAFRSLWLDEVALLLQIRGRSYEALLSHGVAGNQGAPAAYLLLSKAAMSQFLSFEIGARLVSFGCGIGALFVAARLIMVAFQDTFTRSSSLLLVATSPWLIFYSAEGKHYMMETLVALVLVGCAMRYERERLPMIAVVLVGAIAPWFSHNAPVVLCACGTLFIFRAWSRRDLRNVMLLVAMCGVWVVSFALHAATNMRALFGNSELFMYWRHGLAPWHDGFFAVVLWIGSVWGHLMEYVFMPPHYHASSETSAPWWVSVWEIVLVALVVLGIIRMFRERSPLAPYVTLILGVSFSLAILRVSPFSSRLVLYTVPFFLMSAASGVAALVERARGRGSLRAIGAIACALLVIGPSLATSAERFVRPINRSNMKAALRYLAEVRSPDDLLLLRGVDATVAAMYIRRDPSLVMPVLDSKWKIVRPEVMCARLKKRMATFPGRAIWVVGILQAEEVSQALDELGRSCVVVTQRVENDGFVAARIVAREASAN